ncbi:MAG: hypothetical protein AB9819_02175 [Methanomassiliicoccales archaeon]
MEAAYDNGGSELEEFRDHLIRKGVGEHRAESALANVAEFEAHLSSSRSDIGSCGTTGLDEYLAILISTGRNEPERLVDMARYCAFRSRPDLFIHLATMINSYDILPLMEKRLRQLHGMDKCESVFHGFERPPLGTPADAYPPLTARIMRRMEGELSPEQVRGLLTWNYHEIPPQAFQAMKVRFEDAASLDEFLASEHRRLVEELKDRLLSGQPWYEQEVTQDFVDHVASDQKLQTGEREGDRIICVKVPFDPKNYYRETDPQLRRYHYCHCPLARSALKDGRSLPSSSLCHCSAGFTKLPWDVIFEKETQVEVLETVLGGGDRCVFSIRIPQGKMK